MVKTIVPSRFFNIKSIYIKGNNEPLCNKLICFTDNFVIVSDGVRDDSPTWYNRDQIEKMEGVEPARL